MDGIKSRYSAVFAEQPLLTSSIQVATFPKSNNPLLVIPTGAPEERSGGICSAPRLDTIIPEN